MKKLITAAVVMLASFINASAQSAETYLPFSLASNNSATINKVLPGTKKSLKNNGFDIVGEYSPYRGAHIIVVTNKELKKAAASHDRAGYIAAQRVSLTEVSGKLQIAHTNPVYMSHAYHVKSNLSDTAESFKKALGYLKEFGSEQAVSADDLHDYTLTFGMERFDEPMDLASSYSHDSMVNIIEKNLNENLGGAGLVYKIEIPGTQQTLFGVSMKSPDEDNKYMDEAFIMGEIDYKPIRSTAHLPYEILVKGKEAETLHGRFRIPVNFPGMLLMGDHGFMKIMPSSDAISETLSSVAGFEEEEEVSYVKEEVDHPDFVLDYGLTIGNTQCETDNPYGCAELVFNVQKIDDHFYIGGLEEYHIKCDDGKFSSWTFTYNSSNKSADINYQLARQLKKLNINYKVNSLKEIKELFCAIPHRVEEDYKFVYDKK